MNQQIKKILPFIFLIFAIIFGWQAWESYLNFDSLNAETEDYRAKNVKLENVLTEVKRFSSIVTNDSEKISKLNIFLPENAGNPNLISNLENIISARGLVFKKIKFSDPQTPQANSQSQGLKNNSESQLIELSFLGNYSMFKGFLTNIENNLRVMDVTNLDFKRIGESSSNNIAGENQPKSYEFSVKLKTYWMPPEKVGKFSVPSNSKAFSDLAFIKGKQFNDLIYPAGYNVNSDKEEKNENIF